MLVLFNVLFYVFMYGVFDNIIVATVFAAPCLLIIDIIVFVNKLNIKHTKKLAKY